MLKTILHIVLPPTTLFLSTLIAIIFALGVKYSKYNCKDHDYLTIAENVYKQWSAKTCTPFQRDLRKGWIYGAILDFKVKYCPYRSMIIITNLASDS